MMIVIRGLRSEQDVVHFLSHRGQCKTFHAAIVEPNGNERQKTMRRRLFMSRLRYVEKKSVQIFVIILIKAIKFKSPKKAIRIIYFITITISMTKTSTGSQ